MKLEIECTWNEKKHKAKMTICFDSLPKTLFAMPPDQIRLIQKLGREGDKGLAQLKEIKMRYPRSLYATFVYFQALEFFKQQAEADQLFCEIQDKFPKEVLTRCMLAERALKQNQYEEFKAHFQGLEVLKPIFRYRKLFFFEEALFFHNLWVNYYIVKEQPFQQQKHLQFIRLIMNLLK